MARTKNGFFVAIATTFALLGLWNSQLEGQVNDQMPAADAHQQQAMTYLKRGTIALQQFLTPLEGPLNAIRPSNSGDDVCELNAPLQSANEFDGDVRRASHWVEMKAFHRNSRPPEIADSGPDRSVLEPIVAAQYRNTKQLEALIQANRELRRSVASLENQLTRFAMLQRVKLSDSDVRRMMNSVKENEKHAQEVEKLHAELRSVDKRIQQLLPKPIPAQPASYLEPVYLPEQPLEPMKTDRH